MDRDILLVMFGFLLGIFFVGTIIINDDTLLPAQTRLCRNLNLSVNDCLMEAKESD